MIIQTSNQENLRFALLTLLLLMLLALSVFSQSSQQKPLTLNQIESLIKNQTPDSVIVGEILDRGIDFVVTEELLRKINPKKIYPKTAAILKERMKMAMPTKNSERVSPTVRILIADFYGPSGGDRAIRQNIIDKLSKVIKQEDLEIITSHPIVETSSNARKLAEDEKADIVLWGWYATSNTTAQISANFEFTSRVPIIPSLKPPEPKQIPINEMNNFSFQVKIGEEYSALILLTLGLISGKQNDLEKAINYYTQALNLKGLSVEMSFQLLRQRGAARIDLASLRGIFRETESSLDLEAALAIHPTDFITLYNIGLINYSRGNTDEGIKNFSSALSLCDDPELKIEILLKLFWSYVIQNDQTNKEKTLEKILSESINLEDISNRNYYLGAGNLLKKNYSESRKYFENAGKIGGDSDSKAAAYLLVGTTFVIESESATDPEQQEALSAKAESYVKLAVESVPNEPEFYRIFGSLKYAENNYQEALEYFSKAIALRPKVLQSYLDRAKIYEALENYPAALKDFEKAVEIDSKSIFAHTAKAQFHKDRKEFQEALDEFDICLSIEKRSEFYSYKAEVYEEKKDYRNARKEALQTVKLEPNFSNRYIELINTYEQQETEKISLENVKYLLLTDKSPYLLIEQASLILNSLKKAPEFQKTPAYKTATSIFEQALILVGTNSEYTDPLHLYNICRLIDSRYSDVNDHKNSINTLSGCLQQLTDLKIENKKLAILYNEKGTNNFILGELDKAIKDYSTAISNNLTEAEYYRNRAVAYRKKKMFTESFSDIAIAISHNPTDIDFYAVRASTYEEMNDFENARKDLLRIIEFKPGEYNSYKNYFLRAKDYRQKISFDENLNLINKLFEQVKSPYIIIEKGFLYYETNLIKGNLADKNYKNALSEFDKAFAVTLTNSEFNNQHYIYGVCRMITDELLERGNYDDGIKYSNKCIKELEEINCNCDLMGDIYNERGVLFYRYGNLDAAVSDFTKALEKKKTPLFFHNRADAYYKKKVFTEALNDINQALTIDAMNLSFYILRSEIYRDKGDFDDAITDLKFVIEKESNANQKAEYQKYLEELLNKAKIPKSDKLP